MYQKQNPEAIRTFRALREHLMSIEAKAGEEHYHQTLQKSKAIAAMLKEKYGVKQIYLYGSLAWGGFGRHSDIDLYLVGFRGNYWQAYSDAETIAAPVPVSLACEEDCIASLRKKVLTQGVLL